MGNIFSPRMVVELCLEALPLSNGVFDLNLYLAQHHLCPSDDIFLGTACRLQCGFYLRCFLPNYILESLYEVDWSLNQEVDRNGIDFLKMIFI